MNNKEELFRKKANTYIVCFNEGCRMHQECLRWQVGQYVDEDSRMVTCINPRYKLAAEGCCDEYRSASPVSMPIGMKQKFYLNMPKHIERKIKSSLIEESCRSTYYKYHNGKLPITPSLLSLIETIARSSGWNGPLEFDDEVIDYVW